jgi:hypothetical protein
MALERMVARALMKVLTGRGYSATQVIREIQRAGYGYHRQTMQDDVRAIQGRIKNEHIVSNIPKDEYVSKRYMVETNLKAAKKYRVHGYADYYNYDTGQYETRPASFYTDAYQRTGDWEQDFTSYNWGAKYGENIQARGFRVRAVEHNQAWPY